MIYTVRRGYQKGYAEGSQKLNQYHAVIASVRRNIHLAKMRDWLRANHEMPNCTQCKLEAMKMARR